MGTCLSILFLVLEPKGGWVHVVCRKVYFELLLTIIAFRVCLCLLLLTCQPRCEATIVLPAPSRPCVNCACASVRTKAEKTPDPKLM